MRNMPEPCGASQRTACFVRQRETLDNLRFVDVVDDSSSASLAVPTVDRHRPDEHEDRNGGRSAAKKSGDHGNGAIPGEQVRLAKPSLELRNQSVRRRGGKISRGCRLNCTRLLDREDSIR